MFGIIPRTLKCRNRNIKRLHTQEGSTAESGVARLKTRVDRMNETLVTNEDIKPVHNHLDNLTMMVIVIGFLNIVAVVLWL